MTWQEYLLITSAYGGVHLMVGLYVLSKQIPSIKALFHGLHVKCRFDHKKYHAGDLLIEDCPTCRKAVSCTYLAIVLGWPFVLFSKFKK